MRSDAIRSDALRASRGSARPRGRAGSGARALLAAALSLALTAGVAAQPALQRADLEELKVAYIYNFAQFAEWPKEAAVGPAFTICAFEREGVGRSLAALEGRRVRNAPVAVAYPKSLVEARRCHVLYVDDAQQASRAALLRPLADLPVLVIGDSGGPAVGTLGLIFEVRADRLRWQVNLGALRRTGIVLSSKLVEMAVAVVDGLPQDRP